MLSYALQLAIAALHAQRAHVDEGWFSVLIATQHVLMWTKLQYFARAFNPTKTTFVDTIRLVVRDLKWFLLFLLLTMVGFGLAFHALYRQDRAAFVVRPRWGRDGGAMGARWGRVLCVGGSCGGGGLSSARRAGDDPLMTLPCAPLTSNMIRQDFSNLWHSLASMFSYLLAMFDLNVFYHSTNPVSAMMLFIVYEFIM